MRQKASTLTRIVLAALTVSLIPLASADPATYSFSPLRYGNWGGKDYGSGTPVDDLDRLFRAHDEAYTRADALYQPRLQQATNAVARATVRAQWLGAYLAANRTLRNGALRLPPLQVYSDGRDNWGAQARIPAAWALRETFCRGSLFPAIYKLPPGW